MRLLSPQASLQPTPQQLMGPSMLAQPTSPSPQVTHYAVLCFGKSTLRSEEKKCCLGCLAGGAVPALVPQGKALSLPHLNSLHHPGVPLCTVGETTGGTRKIKRPSQMISSPLIKHSYVRGDGKEISHFAQLR